jgi:hypothetical protein
MSGAIDVLDPDKPKRILILASNPAVSEQTGWPIGFWWTELTHQQYSGAAAARLMIEALGV